MSGYIKAAITAAAITQPQRLSLSAVAPGTIAKHVIINIDILNHKAISPNPEGLGAIPYAPSVDKIGGRGFTIVGIQVGINAAKLSGTLKKYTSLGFISQAGLSIGLAIIVREELPGELGTLAYALLMARIAVNQIIGPILLRITLVKSGEALRG